MNDTTSIPAGNIYNADEAGRRTPSMHPDSSNSTLCSFSSSPLPAGKHIQINHDHEFNINNNNSLALSIAPNMNKSNNISHAFDAACLSEASSNQSIPLSNQLSKLNNGFKKKKLVDKMSDELDESIPALSPSSSKATNRGTGHQTSEYHGLCWNKTRQSWLVRVPYKGERIYVGNFRDEIAGAKAYDAKALELYGDEASLNFPDPSLAPPSREDLGFPDVVVINKKSPKSSMKKKERKSKKRSESPCSEKELLDCVSSNPSLNSPCSNEKAKLARKKTMITMESKVHKFELSPSIKRITTANNNDISQHIIKGLIDIKQQPIQSAFSFDTNNKQHMDELLHTSTSFGSKQKQSYYQRPPVPLTGYPTHVAPNNSTFFRMHQPSKLQELFHPNAVQFPHDINPLLMLSLVAHMTSDPSSN